MFDFASHFGEDFYSCLTQRGDTLFELTDAMAGVDGPVISPVDLTLLAEHRRGHGALYDALNHGRVDAAGQSAGAVEGMEDRAFALGQGRSGQGGEYGPGQCCQQE